MLINKLYNFVNERQKIVSDKPMGPRGRAGQQALDTRKTN